MQHSIKLTARIGGGCYLINIVLGFFAIGYVPSVVIASGDAALTAANILSHETLYRMGLAAHVIILMTNIPLAVIFYRLFRVVNVNATLMVVFFTLVGTAIEAVDLLNQFVPLLILKTPHSAFTGAQLQMLSYAALQLQGVGFNLGLVFFGCYGISIGFLIYRSSFLPKWIGVAMIVGGTCYLANSFVHFIAPWYAHFLFPYIQIPSGLAELSFCLWLLFAGVHVKKMTT